MGKKISVFLIIAGIIVGCYPFFEQLFTWYWQQRLLTEWEKETVVAEYRELEQLLPIEVELEADQAEDVKNAPIISRGKLLGFLLIDSINLKLPILSGLNSTNLKIGLAFLEKTAKFGEVGNTVLAGHRGRSYGRLLNRLNEVNLDDQIVVSTPEGDYIYSVFNKVIVKPEEVDILSTSKNEKIISLITCEPIPTFTHRLIVQGKLLQ